MLHVCTYIYACLCLRVHVHMCADVCQCQKSTSGVVTQKPSTLLRKGLLLVPGACRLGSACRLVKPDNLLDSSSSTGNQTQFLMVTWPLFTDLTMISALSVLWYDIISFANSQTFLCQIFYNFSNIITLFPSCLMIFLVFMFIFLLYKIFTVIFSKQQRKLIFLLSWWSIDCNY